LTGYENKNEIYQIEGIKKSLQNGQSKMEDVAEI
jgi:hypothetical protein